MPAQLSPSAMPGINAGRWEAGR